MASTGRDNGGPTKPQKWAPQQPAPKQPPTPSRGVPLAAAQRPGEPPRHAQAAGQVGPHSLHSICLGVLGEHLEELLGDPVFCQDILPLLPAHVKACLLAVARLRSLLCDAALALLADREQAVLDLHGCGDRLSDVGIRAALRRMPHLRHCDLTSCPVSAATLRTLGECCPAVEVLRLGSPVTDASAGRGLQDVMPALDQRQRAPAAESWDALLEVEDEGAMAARLAGAGRLMQLQSLAWPNIPFRLAERCRTACPRVALNPGPEEVARRRLPLACDPSMQLDAQLLVEVAGSSRWELPEAEKKTPPVVHIAERFRLAYVSRQERVKAARERAWQQQKRREQRQTTAVDRLIEQWEGEL